MRRLIFAVLILMMAGVSDGANYYVDGGMADDSGDGTTPETAKKTVQAGFNLLGVGGGDTLYVHGGQTYREMVSTARNAASDARNIIYFDWTGVGTNRSRALSNQAIILGSVDSNGGAYKWTTSSSGTNIFPNGNLETLTSGTPDDNTTDNFGTWAEEVTGDGKVDATATADQGNYAVKLIKGTGNASVIQYNKSLTPNTSYILWFR